MHWISFQNLKQKKSPRCPDLRGFGRMGAPLLIYLVACSLVVAQSRNLELSRTTRQWEFFSATGMRARLFGNESGNLEAWVYPLKIFRNFHLRFLTEGRSLPAESLVRTVSVHPESSAIIYAGDTFSVKETLFVPVHEPGAVIKFEVETAHPLEIEAVFERDFQLEWPAALGGTYLNWDAGLRAFSFGEEQRKYSALVGSPTGDLTGLEYQTNYSASQESAIRLGATLKGKETKVIAIAASVSGPAETESTYKHLIADYEAAEKDSAKYYEDYLARTVSLELPDAQLQQAYDWARVSVIQGLVTNPYLGTGLVAGYRTSGTSQRPGHGWVEGGPLLPVKTEFYQSGLGAQALSALSTLAHFAGKDDVGKQLADDFARQKQLVNQAFWSQESGTYAFALDKNNQKVIEPSVLATVPMWFGLLDEKRAGSM